MATASLRTLNPKHLTLSPRYLAPGPLARPGQLLDPIPPGLYGQDAGDGAATGPQGSLVPAGPSSSGVDASGLPVAPVYAAPTLLAPPPMGLSERMASGLAATPAYQPLPFEGGGSRFGRALLSSAARSFGNSTLDQYQAKAGAVSAQNQINLANADKANALATQTYLQRYKTDLDNQGNIQVNKQLDDAMGGQGAFVGKSLKPEIVHQILASEATRKKAELADPQVMVHDPAVAKMLGIEPGATTAQSKFLEAQRILKPSSAGNGATGAGFDAASIAQAMHDKNNPPDPSGYTRGQWGMIVSAWNKAFPGENLTQPIAEWKSFTRNINTMQGTKFVAMSVNLNATDQAISLTRQYAGALAQVAPQYANQPMNALAQKLQQNYSFGGPAQQAAVSRLVGQAEATRLQLASLYMAGGAPTDQAMKHASEILDYKKPPTAFSAQLDVAQNDVLLRRNAYQDAAMQKGVNPYASAAPGTGPLSPSPTLGPQPLQPAQAAPAVKRGGWWDSFVNGGH